MSGGVSKLAAERNHRALLELVSQPGNDICADCKTKTPRWASYNLGIFVCVRCASIHRKIGTHITKIKSLTFDSWTKEQVEVMRSIGNVKSNQKYNPDERKNPPPISMEESERDSDLEKYIRAKYEHRRFIDRSAQVAEYLGPSQSKKSVIPPPRSKTAPIHDSSPSKSNVRSSMMNVSASTDRSSPSMLGTASVNPPPRTTSSLQGASRSSVYVPNSSGSIANASSNPFPISQIQPQVQSQAKPPPVNSGNPLWNDLASLQAPSVNSSLPLQFASAPASTSSFASQPGFPANPAQTQAQVSSPFQTNQNFAVPNSAPVQSQSQTQMNTNPYANLSLTPSNSNSFSAGPAFPPSFGSSVSVGGHSPNARSFSLPVYGGANAGAGVSSSPAPLVSMPTGLSVQVQHSQPQPMPYNPFSQLQAQQQQQQQFFTPTTPMPMSLPMPSPVIQPSSAPNPFTQSFINGTPNGMHQTYLHPSMTPQPQQSPFTSQLPLPSPGISFTVSGSPSSFSNASSYPFQQTQQTQTSISPYGGSPASPLSQQAQQAQQLFQSMVSNTNPFQNHV